MRVLYAFICLICLCKPLHIAAQNCTASQGTPLLFENFGAGSTTQQFGPPIASNLTQLNYTQSMCPGFGNYALITNVIPTGSCPGFHRIKKDHTGNPFGYFMMIDASDKADDIYVKNVTGLCAGTTYDFSAWFLTLFTEENLNIPNIRFTIETASGVLASYTTGNLPVSKDLNNPPAWKKYGLLFTAPATVNSVLLRVRNLTPGFAANDYAVDDISFVPTGPAIAITTANGIARDTTLCIGSNITFTASVDNCYATTSYQWQQSVDGGVTWADITGANAATFTTTPSTVANSLLYRLNVSSAGISSCGVFSESVEVKTLSYTTTDISITASPGNKICPGTEVTFTATPVNGGSSPQYQWQVNGTNAGNTTATFKTTSLANADVVRCILTSNAACLLQQTDTSNVIQIQTETVATPTVTIQASAMPACSSTPVTFSVLSTTNAGTQPGYNWLLNGIATASGVASFTSSTLQNNDKVQLVITSSLTCSPQASSNVITAAILPTPVIQLAAQYVIKKGEEVTLTPTVTGNANSYAWQPVTHLSNPFVLQPVASPVTTTAYQLTVTAANGCMAKANTMVKVVSFIIVPNAFSPNGDGINDAWILGNIEDFVGSRVTVFNRNGHMVFNSSNVYQPWNGLYNGRPVPAGVYYYVIDKRNGEPLLTGYVTVLR